MNQMGFAVLYVRVVVGESSINVVPTNKLTCTILECFGVGNPQSMRRRVHRCFHKNGLRQVVPFHTCMHELTEPNWAC